MNIPYIEKGGGLRIKRDAIEIEMKLDRERGRKKKNKRERAGISLAFLLRFCPK